MPSHGFDASFLVEFFALRGCGGEELSLRNP